MIGSQWWMNGMRMGLVGLGLVRDLDERCEKIQ